MQINSLEELIRLFSRLPSLGPKSAKRIALHLIQNKQEILRFANLLVQTAEEIKSCDICGNIDIRNPCYICIDSRRERSILCVVETISDLWAMEKNKVYKGLYHVLGGTLSAIEGRAPKNLNIESIKDRVHSNSITEVIIATNFTLEGQTTGHYIAKLLEPMNIKISRLANGIPIGAELDYVDEGTLSLALKLRCKF
jgi:recombination protein RecR